MAQNLLYISSFVNKVSDQATTLKKSYVDNSSFSFDAVFDSANKTYNTDKTFSETSSAEKFTADNATEKENFNKVEDKKSYDDSSKIKEKEKDSSD